LLKHFPCLQSVWPLRATVGFYMKLPACRLIMIVCVCRLSFYMAGDPVLFKAPELGALQTHLCVIWDSTSGLAALFLDGKRSLSKIYRKGHTVSPGGRVILGQDPDSFLGSFDEQQSFVGEICDVNMWDVVLADSVIQGMFAGKRVARGNVFDWESTELRINGDVEVAIREL
uniref:Pentraxin family member n=1 Tax=Haplochromis burtoni TaxID=8153 RepID=A0A3Q2WTB3_HAPBU